MVPADREVAKATVAPGDHAGDRVHTGDRSRLPAHAIAWRCQPFAQRSLATRLRHDSPPERAALLLIHPAQNLHDCRGSDEVIGREARAIDESKLVRINT